MNVNNKKWIDRYLDLAEQVSTWSLDPSTKIGAVAVNEDGQVISQGYNGFPRGIEDTQFRLNDRETKYELVVHAEKNLIYNACLNGISLKNSYVFIYGLPVCGECTKGLIQCGVKKIFMRVRSPDTISRRKIWFENFKNISAKMLKETGIDYIIYEEDNIKYR